MWNGIRRGQRSRQTNNNTVSFTSDERHNWISRRYAGKKNIVSKSREIIITKCYRICGVGNSRNFARPGECIFTRVVYPASACAKYTCDFGLTTAAVRSQFGGVIRSIDNQLNRESPELCLGFVFCSTHGGRGEEVQRRDDPQLHVFNHSDRAPGKSTLSRVL